ncbi:MAG TPA: Clp protease N-terminal domain-containing protein [Acidimicrobiales bacterium]|jgi:ATP-dependent Clp protease ATP-binding subunit ClpC
MHASGGDTRSFPTTATARRVAKVPFAPEAKRSLELSLREALRLGHGYIGTEHLLLGLLRQAEVEEPNWLAPLCDTAPESLKGAVEEMLHGSGVDRSLSPALTEATARARHLAGGAPITTGHLLQAVLEDRRCLATKALEALGVAKEAVDTSLGRLDVGESSDAAARPARVELRAGATSVTLDDPGIAAALADMSADQVQSVLRQALGNRAGRPSDPAP